MFNVLNGSGSNINIIIWNSSSAFQTNFTFLSLFNSLHVISLVFLFLFIILFFIIIYLFYFIILFIIFIIIYYFIY